MDITTLRADGPAHDNECVAGERNIGAFSSQRSPGPWEYTLRRQPTNDGLAIDLYLRDEWRGPVGAHVSVEGRFGYEVVRPEPLTRACWVAADRIRLLDQPSWED